MKLHKDTQTRDTSLSNDLVKGATNMKYIGKPTFFFIETLFILNKKSLFGWKYKNDYQRKIMICLI